MPPTQYGELNGKPSSDVFSQFRLPPRALPTLEAVLIEEGYENVRSINPIHHGRNGRLTSENMQRIYESDVVGLSTITRTSDQTMTLARQVKDINPDAIVLAGGFDATFRYEDWLESGAVDIVVRGEGEQTLSELLLALEGGDLKDLSGVNGIAYMDGSDLVLTDTRDLLSAEELGKLPLPHYDGPIKKKMRSSVVEASRGCPHDCDFCGVTRFYGRNYRKKPDEYVLAAVENIVGASSTFFFTDDNFAADPKRTIRILDKIHEMGKLKYGTVQVTDDVAENPELLEAFKRTGVNILCIGIESIFDDSRDALGKIRTAEEVKKNIHTLREYGFWIHGMMMPGADGDTIEKLRETSDWANTYLNSVQFFPPTPIPGTEFYEQMQEQGRILPVRYSLYDGQRVVVRPKDIGEHTMTAYQLQTQIHEMYKSFYSGERFVKQFPRRRNNLRNIPLHIKINVWARILGGLNEVLYNKEAMEHLDYLKSLSGPK